MGLFDRLFGARSEPESAVLYAAVVTAAREPHWYLAGGVPDTIDGRFDMVAAVLSVVLLRLERDGDAAAPSAQLTERFIDDMDGQLRESGIGDVGIGKHVGKMMSMLGGRLGAYRETLAGGDLADALQRNLYRGAAPGEAAVDHVATELRALRDRLDARTTSAIVAGDIG